jgi:hypothetical protein
MLWLLVAGGVLADQPILIVDGVPDHGIVVRHVDLTAAVRLSQAGAVDAASISAADTDGESVPFQFVPDADFDAKGNVAGLMAARLTPNRANRLALTFGAAAERGPQSESIETPFYTIVHDPRRGGMPTKIVFRDTGKVFDNFRWQDRLHHSDVGGFVLQNDGEASVECIAAGPLCTVVRVRARYAGISGKAAASNAEAEYRWVYLHDLPLVYVTAEVKQAAAFEWDELHFLELNFPGEDFKRWAGGEPLSEGVLGATGKSHHAAQWGALVDERNAIAMFDCGQIIFHDGRGGYGTYLHAHGDRAWRPWSGTRTQLSAWLWIGAADEPVRGIQASVTASPSAANVIATTAGVQEALQSGDLRKDAWRGAMARQLEAAGRLKEALDVAQGRLLSKWMWVEAGEMNLILERRPGGIRLLSLFDTAAGRELLAAEASPLFTIDVRDSQTKEHVSITASMGWHRVQVSEPDASGRRVATFEDLADARLKGIRVTMELFADKSSNALDWDLQVINDSERWGLWRVTFPQVTVSRPGEGARVFLPHTAGIELSGMWDTAGRRGGTYPSGWTCMQYMAAYDAAGRTGLYVGVHDPYGSTKDILAEGLPDRQAVAFWFDHPVADMGNPGADFDLPGQARWQLLRGDWFDAAVVYREWVRREARWWPQLGPDGRGDTPEWMRQLPAWVMTGGAPGDCVPQVKQFVRDVGVPVGFHWYNWHQIPFDNDYPHYFPPKEGFAEGVAELKAAGVYAMPYINGRLWDTHDGGAEDRQFTSIALPAATKDEDGKPCAESYGSKETDGGSVQLAAMCPATALWQGRVGEIVLRLLGEYGLSGVYIDQVAAAAPRLCFDASHGHPLGGGHWWTEGYWKMLDAIRAAKPAGCMLTTECNAEPYIKWFDGYLTWHWQEQDMVPAFSAVYGGAVQMFGRAYRGGPSQDLANRMKAGQQLVFGEQIGWFGPEIIQRADSGPFVRDCIQLRWRLKDYFYAGRMVRPPKLSGAVPTVTADWQWQNEWPITTDAVMVGAWQRSDGSKVVLLFANVSDTAITSTVQIEPKDYGLSGQSLKAITIGPGGLAGEVAVSTAGQAKIDLPPRTVAAWEITGVNR